jgi:chitinase
MTSKTYTTYVTTWNNDPFNQIDDMISRNVVQSNTRIVLAFASFNFSATTYIPGFGNISMDEVKDVVDLVHEQNAKISLSIGGATYPFYGSDLYNSPGDLASNINTVLNTCGFDGVDFDIEDSYLNVPSNFANQAGSLINTLKSLNNKLYITLTTPAQAWAMGCYQQQLLNLTFGNLSAWQPMEYDLWIDPTSDYYNQIQYDINFYINSWSVNPGKIILGLMPGKDDMGRDLTLQNALNLTSFALDKNLMGVMTWDANIDGNGVDGNAPYAYSMGIQSLLNNKSNSNQNLRLQSGKRMRNGY